MFTASLKKRGDGNGIPDDPSYRFPSDTPCPKTRRTQRSTPAAESRFPKIVSLLAPLGDRRVSLALALGSQCRTKTAEKSEGKTAKTEEYAQQAGQADPDKRRGFSFRGGSASLYRLSFLATLVRSAYPVRSANGYPDNPHASNQRDDLPIKTALHQSA